jgi:hypothetical protein
VKISAVGLATLNRLTKEMYDGARTAHAAAEEARALVAKLEGSQSTSADALKTKLTALAAPPPAGGGRGGRGAGPGGTAEPSSLDGVAVQMIAAAMPMQSADVAPTARDVAATAEAQRQFTTIMARWTEAKSQAAAVK